MEMEDLKWRQRAKHNLYQQGDRNTKYSHACASKRRSRNTILQIRDSNDMVLEKQEEIEAAFKAYFTDLFTTSGPSTSDIDKCLLSIECKVSKEMNESISRPFTRVDVEEALK